MHLELYQYVEGDEKAEVGEYLGYISLEDDDICIDVGDPSLEEDLERLFSEPLKYTDGMRNEEKEIEPYTPEFFKRVIAVLPDYNLRGILREDEDREPLKDTSYRDDDEESEDEEIAMSSGMMSIEDLTEEEYQIPDDREEEDEDYGDDRYRDEEEEDI